MFSNYFFSIKLKKLIFIIVFIFIIHFFYFDFLIEHCITPQILHRLTNEDLRILCPIIGERIILEDYIKSLNIKDEPAKKNVENNINNMVGRKFILNVIYHVFINCLLFLLLVRIQLNNNIKSIFKWQ